MRVASGHIRCASLLHVLRPKPTQAVCAQHHCNPLIIPSNTSMQFYCVVEPQDGVFLCYFRYLSLLFCTSAMLV